MQNDPYYSDTTEKATDFTNPYAYTFSSRQEWSLSLERQRWSKRTNKQGDLAVAPSATPPNGISSPAGSAPSPGCVKSGYNALPSGAAGA